MFSAIACSVCCVCASFTEIVSQQDKNNLNHEADVEWLFPTYPHILKPK